MKNKLHVLVVLFFIMLAGMVNAQTRLISGKVTAAADNSPIAGVTVRVVGSTIAVQTDVAGNYSINVPSENNLLSFAYVGYATRQFELSGIRPQTVNIALEMDSRGLDEVVITASGTTAQRRELGTAATTIKAEQVVQGKASNIAASLSGKVPGLQVSAVNGGVNPNYRLVLRGQRSITGDNQALLILDNLMVPNSLLGNLNPEDIEDIQVLNGAAAAAAYGSEASNGAIVITTKKGKAGQNLVRLSHTSTLEQVSYFPKLQERFGAGTTPDAVKTYTPYENQQYGPAFDGSMVPIGKPLEDGSIQTVKYSPVSDKYDFWENGLSNQTDLTLTSGDEKSTYYISGQFFDQSATMPGDQYSRISARANGTRQVYENFSVQFSTNYINNWYDLTTQGTSVYNELLQTSAHVPLTRYKDWENDPYANPNGYFNEYYDNPYFTIGNWRQNTKNEYFQGNLELNYKPFNNTPLNFIYRVGISSTNAQNKSRANKFIFTDYTKSISGSSKTDVAGSVSDSRSGTMQLVTELIANYREKLSDDFTLTGLVAGSLRDNSGKSVGVSASGLVISGLYNVSNTQNNPGATESNNRTRNMSIRGEARLGFRDYLYLHVTGRNDWTSVLNWENSSFFYPSADVSFIASDAFPALKNNNWLESLKFRAAYAYVGNVNLGAYALNTTFSQGSGYPYGGSAGFTVGGGLVADNLKPEITKGPEAGVDFALLNGDITGGFSWYKTNTFNQTISISVSNASGYSTLRTNIGEVENKGIETYLRYTPIRNANGLTVTVGANYTLNQNKVLSLFDDGETTTLNIGTATGGVIVAEVGQPFPLLKNTRYLRDDQGRVIVNANSGFPSFDGSFSITGPTTPPHILGTDLEVRFKSLRFNTILEYRTGHFVQNSVTTGFDFSGSGIRTTWFNRERFVFPNSSYLDPSTGQYVANTDVQTRSGGADFWTDGTRNTGAGENYSHSAAFWKLREASLSYDLPSTYFNGYVKGVTVSLQGRNLFVWVPETNLYTDPEYSALGAGSNAVGFTSLGQSPPARYFGGTLTLNF